MFFRIGNCFYKYPQPSKVTLWRPLVGQRAPCSEPCTVHHLCVGTSGENRLVQPTSVQPSTLVSTGNGQNNNPSRLAEFCFLGYITWFKSTITLTLTHPSIGNQGNIVDIIVLSRGNRPNKHKQLHFPNVVVICKWLLAAFLVVTTGWRHRTTELMFSDALSELLRLETKKAGTN